MHSDETNGRSGSSRPVLVFITESVCGLTATNAPLFWLAAEAGFSSYVVPINCLHPAGSNARTPSGCEAHTILCGGFEAILPNERRPICRYGERITPSVVCHRIRLDPTPAARCEELARAHPKALLSFHPELTYIGTKWGAELCFRAGKQRGIRVARPKTYLVSKAEIGRALKEAGEAERLIFKPAQGHQGRGIRVSTPASFDAVVREIEGSEIAQFVVQQLVSDAVRLDDTAFDIRLYALASSFDPLRYQVYREGIVRCAARPMQPGHPLDPRSVLTNCAYRESCGESVHNLTVDRLLDELAQRGYRVEDFWDQIDALVRSVFECFRNWAPLARLSDVSRRFLLTGLDIILASSDGTTVRPVFIESNHTPLLHNFGPPAVDQGLLRTTRQWLDALLAKSQAAAPVQLSPQSVAPRDDYSARGISAGGRPCRTIRDRLRSASTDAQCRLVLPAAEIHLTPKTTVEGLIEIDSRSNGSAVLQRARSVLSHAVTRETFLDAIASQLSGDDGFLILPGDEDLGGLKLSLRQKGRYPVLDASFDQTLGFRALSHPLSAVLPRIDEEEGSVDTEPWPGARFEYLNPHAVGPRFGNDQPDREADLLRYLGRLIARQPTSDPSGKRYVEPGVGRSALVDFLRIADRPELADFSALGTGLTPYSQEFILKGPEFDGLCSLKKAWHRHRIAEQLEEAGCRVPKTAAIIALPNLEKTWADGRREPAGILIRGFRTVLRVQQLDPLHGFLLSDRHRPVVARFLLGQAHSKEEPGRDAEPSFYGLQAFSSDPELCRAICRINCKGKCLRDIVHRPESDTRGWSPPQRLAADLRLQQIYSYAPVLLGIAKRRVAREIGRDPVRETLSDREYVGWFAERMGEQLALMKARRFLNDYRMARSDWRSNALYESQVSLLAECIDLDTGIFEYETDPGDLDGVLLTSEELASLRFCFSEFHERDVQEASAIVRTVALIVFRGDPAAGAEALEQFDRAYRHKTPSRVFGGAPSESVVVPLRSRARAGGQGA